MNLGARTFKTGLAVVLALLLARIFNLPSPVFAGTSAALAMQPSIYRSYITLIEQIQGNVIGAILAIAFALAFGNDVLVIGMAAIILIMVHIQLKIDSSIPLSLATLIVLMETPGDEFFPYSLLRFLTIMLGVLAAFAVNISFFPPKYEKRLFASISELTNDILKWIRVTRQQSADHQKLKRTIEDLKDRLIKLDQLYLLFKEDRGLSIKKKFKDLRKLVLYRQMIQAAKSALNILKKQNQCEHVLEKISKESLQQISAIIFQLISNHEQLLMRYVDQVVPHHELEMDEYKYIRKELFVIYQTIRDLEDIIGKEAQLFQYFAAIMDYNEQLSHLELLLSRIEAYHENDKQNMYPV